MRKRLFILRFLVAGIGGMGALRAQTPATNEPPPDLVKPAAEATTLRRQAYALHRLAADGDKRASAVLAAWKRQGVGNSRLYVNVAKLEKLAAERNDPEMWARLGLAYLRGEGGVSPDAPRGIALLEKASDAGNNSATLNLGLLYFLAQETTEVPRDPEKAKGYFQLLAQRGDPRGTMEIGWIYRDVDKDPARAAESFEMAGRAGIVEGYKKAGQILRFHPEAPIEQRRHGLELLQKASDSNDLEATLVVGLAYLGGAPEAPQDLTVAARHLTRVLESRYPSLHNRLLDALYGLQPGAKGGGPTPTALAARQQGLRQIENRRAADPAVEKFLKRLETARKNRPSAQ